MNNKLNTLTLSQAVEGFCLSLAARGYSTNTIDLYRWALTKLTDYLNNTIVISVTPQRLESFLALLYASDLSTSSVENAWKAIRSFYNWAEETLDIPRPDANLPRPRVTYKEIIPFAKEEVNSLLTACTYTRPATTEQRRAYRMKRPTADRDKAIVLTLLDTGLRVSELARLQVDDLDLTTGEMRVLPFGSGRKTRGRTVYLGKASRAALWKYLLSREGSKGAGAVFLTGAGREMNRHSIRHLLNHLGERAGVHNVHPHRFRHTFAIQYLRNGGDVFTLQRLLGHSSLQMVQRYLDIAQSDIGAAHRRASPADNWRL